VSWTKEQWSTYSKKYYRLHREEILRKQKEQRAGPDGDRLRKIGAEQNRKWRAANHDEVLAEKRAYRERNRDKIRERDNKFREEHREERRAAEKIYRQEHREEINKRSRERAARIREEKRIEEASYYEEHPEETEAEREAEREARIEAKKEWAHSYYEKNKESIREYRAAKAWQRVEYDAEYHEANRERIAARKRLRYSEDPAKFIAKTIARRAARLGAPEESLAEIEEIYRQAKERKTLRCYLCNRLIPLGDRHVDHIFPASKGGPTRPSNLAVACSKCNLKKSAKLPEEIGLLL